jgi:glycosyltransferase involved in cell wall biosynthesis
VTASRRRARQPSERRNAVRVLHLTSSFPRDAGDHVAPFLLDLARAQEAAGLEVAVLAPHDQGARRSEDLGPVGVHRFRYAPARWERLAYRGGLLGRSRTPAGLALLPVFFAAFTVATLRLARRFRPDVLHAHWWLPAGVCALLASRLLRLPLVVTLHGTDVHLLRHPLLRRLALLVLRRAALVVVVSEDLQRLAVESLGLPPEQVAVLRMPVARVPSPAPVPDGGPVRLVAAGRLSVEKGFDVLLEAVGLALQDGLDVRLDLVGSGPEHDRLSALAAGLAGRVQMVPAQPRDALWKRMDAAQVLVVPSRREGLGLVALEAIARGRPVIASRAGGLPEVVCDGVDGVLVPPGDPRALADALHKLPLAPPTGAALERHAPADVGQAHRAAYERLLSRG